VPAHRRQPSQGREKEKKKTKERSKTPAGREKGGKKEGGDKDSSLLIPRTNLLALDRISTIVPFSSWGEEKKKEGEGTVRLASFAGGEGEMERGKLYNPVVSPIAFYRPASYLSRRDMLNDEKKKERKEWERGKGKSRHHLSPGEGKKR